MAGAFTRDGHVIQKNGLPRKNGFSRSITNLSQAGLSAFEVDIETIKSSVRTTEAPSNRRSDLFYQHPSNLPSSSIRPPCPAHNPTGSKLPLTNGHLLPGPGQALRTVGQTKLYQIGASENIRPVSSPSNDYKWAPLQNTYKLANGDTKLPPYPLERPVISSSPYRTNGYELSRPPVHSIPHPPTPNRTQEARQATSNAPFRYLPEQSPVRGDQTSRSSPKPYQFFTAFSEISTTTQSRISEAVPAVQAALPAIETQNVHSRAISRPTPLFASKPEPLKAKRSAPTYQETFSNRNSVQYEPVGPLATGRCERVLLGDTRFRDHSEVQKSLQAWLTEPVNGEAPPPFCAYPLIRDSPVLRPTPRYDELYPNGPLPASRYEPASSMSTHLKQRPTASAVSTSMKDRDQSVMNSPVTSICSPLDLPETYVHSVDRHRTAVACQFYMQQRMENVVKYQADRLKRRQHLEAEMAKTYCDEPLQKMLRAVLVQKESNFLRLKRAQGTNKIGAKDFSKIRTIGEGAFGQVILARKKTSPRESCDLYAIKIMDKSTVEDKNQFAHVKAERDILAEADNEWVVKLFYSFQDDRNLYLVLEYVPGGDMMTLLQIKERFNEEWARFYTAELVCAIGSVHQMGFVHRDIKPDNILIDKDGHIKLTDFGLCTGFRWSHRSDANSVYGDKTGIHVRSDSLAYEKRPQESPSESTRYTKQGSGRNRRKSAHHRQVAHSQVGTPNYMAPEVIACNYESGYTQVCDWWSLGVILYEMIVGHAPFYAGSADETQRKVLNWQSHLNLAAPELSKMAADLISRLCCEAEHRLGNAKSELISVSPHDTRPVTVLGTEEIKNHPFFRSIKWNLRDQPAPFVPRIKHGEDTSHFSSFTEDFTEDKSIFPSEDQNGDLPQRVPSSNGLGQKNHVYEFTFRRFFTTDNDYLSDPQVVNTPVHNADGEYTVPGAITVPVYQRDDQQQQSDDSWILSHTQSDSRYSRAPTRSATSSRSEQFLYNPPSYCVTVAASDTSSSGNSQDNVQVFV